MNKIALIIFVFCSSCTFHTAVTYQQHRKGKYIREEGYVVSCEKQTIKSEDYLIVGVYTPSTYNAYYTYLEGIKSEKEVEILNVELQFVESGENLELVEKGDAKSYWFYAKNLNDIIEKNKSVKITLLLQDSTTGKKEKKEFLLTRKKRTYPTGTFPHA